MAVYTGRGGDHLHASSSGLRPSGHRPRGGGATGQAGAVPPGKHPELLLGRGRPVTTLGVAVHRTRGDGAHRGSTSSLTLPHLNPL
jgi:hypothetical protein